MRTRDSECLEKTRQTCSERLYEANEQQEIG